jgi:hypothetical protein
MAEFAQVCRYYVDLLTWPWVALVAIIMYRSILRSLLPGAKVKFTISGVTFETTLPVVEASISQSLYEKNSTRRNGTGSRDCKRKRKAPV